MKCGSVALLIFAAALEGNFASSFDDSFGESVSARYFHTWNAYFKPQLLNVENVGADFNHVKYVVSKAEIALGESLSQLEPHLDRLLPALEYLLADTSHELFKDFPVDNCTTRTLAFIAEYAADCALKNGNLTLACLEPLLIAGLQIFDATGKIPAGISQGQLFWTADYDTCRSVNVLPIGVLERDPLTMKTCIMQDTIGTTNLYTFFLGVCAPQFCSAAEIGQLYGTALSALGQLGEYVDEKYNITVVSELYLLLDIEFHVVGVGNCVDEGKPYANVTIAALCVAGLFAFLVTVSTVYDIWNTQMDYSVAPVNQQAPDTTDDTDILIPVKSQTPSTLIRSFLAFSAYTNGSKLLSTDTPKHDLLGCLHGIRLISILWVMLGHCYNMFIIPLIVDNPAIFASYSSRFTIQFVINGTFSVDTFFVLSGTLVSYLTISQLDSLNGVISWLKFWAVFYFHRFWRLTPVYMAVLFLYVGIFPIWSTGPIWPQELDKNCVDNWWTNFLYINNLTYDDNQCIGWTWYLANDMQFYLLSPIFIYAFWKRPIIGWSLTVFAQIVHFGTQFGFTYHNKQKAAIFSVCPNSSQPLDNYGSSDTYYKPWCRVGPYAMGLALGYLLQKSRGKWKLPVYIHFGGWVTGIVCGTLVIYGLYPVYNCTYQLSQTVDSLYLASSRLLWGLVICGLIWSCAHHDTPINKLLSWSALRPFSRLTYTAYLIHILVYYAYLFSLRRAYHIYDIDDVWMYMANIWFSFGLAAIVSLTFEAPAMALEKIFLPRGKA